MARAVADIQNDIRALQEEERVELLRVLLEELDGAADPNIEQVWLDEIQRRSRELDSGTVKTISASDVFAQARAGLKS